MSVPALPVLLNTTSNKDVVLDENQSSDIGCFVSRAYPAAVISWYKNNRTQDNLHDDIRVLETKSVVVKNSDDTYKTTSYYSYIAQREDNEMRIYCAVNNTGELTLSVPTSPLDIKCEFFGCLTLHSYTYININSVKQFIFVCHTSIFA